MTSLDLGLAVAFSVMVLVNLVGNSLVCLVVLRYRGMRTPINYLLVNLALSDMMVALAITPQYVLRGTFHHPSGTAGDYMCKFITGDTFIWIGVGGSTFSLVAVAAERYLTVVRPLGELPGRNTRRLSAVITTSWIYALFFQLPFFFVLRFEDVKFDCKEHWPNNKLAKAVTISCFFGVSAIPMGVMTFLYSRVLYTLWKGGVRSSLLSDQARSRARLVAKMVIILSIQYTAFRSPRMVLFMLSLFKPGLTCEYGSDNYRASVVLVGLHSAMNPFIYAFSSTNFRQHVREALHIDKRITFIDKDI